VRDKKGSKVLDKDVNENLGRGSWFYQAQFQDQNTGFLSQLRTWSLGLKSIQEKGGLEPSSTLQGLPR